MLGVADLVIQVPEGHILVQAEGTNNRPYIIPIRLIG